MNNFINAVIIDDTEICVSNLQIALSKYTVIQISGMAINASDGKKLILKNKPVLVFLDVELPDMSGIEMLREIRDQITWPLQVIFYTAYDKYLLDALRESAFDYLLKPFENDDLDKVLTRYFEHREKSNISNNFHDSLARLLPDNSIFLIATIDGFQILRLEQIGYFRYLTKRKQWLVALSDHKELQLRRNTNAKDILNYSPSFVQIHRDHIININYLSIIRGGECMLFPPFELVKGLKTNSSFIKFLQEKFSQL